MFPKLEHHMQRQPIKVVHISTYINGGAGIAACRLHKALLKQDVHSSFVCIDSPGNATESIYRIVGKKASLLNRILNKLPGPFKYRLEKLMLHGRETALLKKLYPLLKCSFASLPFSNYDVLSNPAVKDADIIHLHWVAGLLDYPSFFKHNKKPVVWTMHDMNPMKGLYHYDEDEQRNISITKAFDDRIKQVKQHAIQEKLTDLFWVTPSSWLGEKVKSSTVFGGIDGTCIPNCVNTAVFKPQETTALRTALNIPPEQTIFLFVAEAVGDYRKGFDLLIKALDDLPGKDVTLLVVGTDKVSFETSANVIALGTIRDEEKLSHYYSLADAFIIPSREDNLPNVMVEALCCGTPVLSFDTGGMAKVIENDVTGLKARQVSANGLKNLLIAFIEKKNQFNPGQIRQFAAAEFDEQKVTTQYLAVYKQLLAKN